MAETCNHQHRRVARIASFNGTLNDSFGKSPGIDAAHRRNMTTIFTYRDLEAWKQGMDLVEQCYRLTASFPKGEQSRLGFISPTEKKHTIIASDSVGRLLNGLHRSLELRLAASLELPPQPLATSPTSSD